MTYISPGPGVHSVLFGQLMRDVSAHDVWSLSHHENPAEGGLQMMSDDDLDIVTEIQETEIQEWVEREDIAEIAEDLDPEDQEGQDNPETEQPLLAQWANT